MLEAFARIDRGCQRQRWWRRPGRAPSHQTVPGRRGVNWLGRQGLTHSDIRHYGGSAYLRPALRQHLTKEIIQDVLVCHRRKRWHGSFCRLHEQADAELGRLRTGNRMEVVLFGLI